MTKEKLSLDVIEVLPEDMVHYLKHYGFHFNKKALDCAVSKMMKDGKHIKEMSKADVDTMLKKYNVVLENNTLYDATFVANMAVSDFYGTSIEDEEHLALYVKDLIDDEDLKDGFIFCRWYSDRMHSGEPIDWAELV